MNALMSPYLDGLLDGAQTRRLEHHVETCKNCRYKLELLQEIPTALQTDRMAAPRPEFTAMVMQKVVITAQFQRDGSVEVQGRAEFRSETQYTFRGTATSEQNQASRSETKVLEFPFLRRATTITARPAKAPGVYLLHFASVAAALVIMVGIGVYTFQFGTGSAPTETAAYTNVVITSFAQNLTETVQSPVEVLIGVAVTFAVVVCLWFFFLRTRKEEQSFEQEELTRRR
jgi:hypothetical protein